MVTIRKAIKSDAQVIYDLRSRAILDKCSAYYSKEKLLLWTQGELAQGFIEDVAQTFYVSEVNHRVIGSGKLDIETGIIDAIFVDPDYFGVGAAKQMLNFLETLARKNTIKLLKLDATLNAASFYRLCGFSGEKVSTYHSPRGITLDCIPMEKNLEAV